MAHFHAPSIPTHLVAGAELSDTRRRSATRRLPAARAEDIDTALMFDARSDIWSVDAVLAKQLVGHPRERRGAVHQEIGDLIRAHVPALKHEPWVLETVVVMQMAEEHMADVDRTTSTLHEALMRAGAVIQDDHIIADFEEVPGALSRERRRGSSGAEQSDFQEINGVLASP